VRYYGTHILLEDDGIMYLTRAMQIGRTLRQLMSLGEVHNVLTYNVTAAHFRIVFSLSGQSTNPRLLSLNVQALSSHD
jgi:hypothetical protein